MMYSVFTGEFRFNLNYSLLDAISKTRKEYDVKINVKKTSDESLQEWK